MGKIPTDLLKNIFGGADFSTIEELLAHLKKFKIKQKDYFEDTFPRKDLLTGEKIEYKNIENYFNSDFVNKNNLKKYIKQNPEGGKSWSIEYLENRKEEKGLIYSPSQAELRSLFCPSIPYFESVGGYNEICDMLGYKNRYDYKKELVFNKLTDPTIIIDSREKLPLKLITKSEVAGLKVGDYAIKDSKLNIFERRLILDAYKDGTFKVISAPKLLDEGIDIPEADLAIVSAASRSRRQMIQRMGRVLRKKKDGGLAKIVILYVVNTSEDPSFGAHETFIGMILEAAESVKNFDYMYDADSISEYLCD